jgi:hypothetical protein
VYDPCVVIDPDTGNNIGEVSLSSHAPAFQMLQQFAVACPVVALCDCTMGCLLWHSIREIAEAKVASGYLASKYALFMSRRN